jgi:hypothetical protein
MNDNDLLTTAINKISDDLGLMTRPKYMISTVRLWMALYGKLGGDHENMLHWMNTFNKTLGFIPRFNLDNKDCLDRMIEYLEYEH